MRGPVKADPSRAAVPEDWLTVTRGGAPLIVSLPHTGTDIPPEIEARLISPWLARKDADWWVEKLYAFAADLGATLVRTSVSRTVIDVNRDPGGASLYPGQATTGLCPVTTFDGEALYHDGEGRPRGRSARRRETWFEPYHAALAEEIARLRQAHGAVVLYEGHSIRSRIPRLFEGDLPNFNIGTNGGASCDPALAEVVSRTGLRRRPRLLVRRQRPVQGRLDHPSLRRSGRRRPRPADGAGLPRLHGRSGRAAGRRRMAGRLGPGAGRADAPRARRRHCRLSRFRRRLISGNRP